MLSIILVFLYGPMPNKLRYFKGVYKLFNVTEMWNTYDTRYYHVEKSNFIDTG